MKRLLGIRIDLDFGICVTQGVPFLLEALEQYGYKVTFFATMGPDGFRKNLYRIQNSSYWKRIIALNPVKIIKNFGLAYLVKSFLNQSRNVGADRPDILRKIQDEGHELGLHGYDHYWWAEHVWEDDTAIIEAEMEKGLTAYLSAVGIESKIWASPNWRCSKAVLELVDRKNFLYGADCRGHTPFLPILDGYQAKTIQLPVTLPCLHEIKQDLGTGDPDILISHLISKIKPDFNILCLHGYYEGVLERKLFSKLLEELEKQQFSLVSLKTLFEYYPDNQIPHCQVIRKSLPGGRGEVSFQGPEVS